MLGRFGRKAQPATPLTGRDALLLDLDGVVYTGPGAIPHAVESITRAAGQLRVGYITNNASRTDESVAQHLRELGLRVFTMREVDERGLSAVMADALEVATRHTAGFHLSCDLDWVDPLDAPGVGTPVRGGATYREAHLAMELVSDAGALVAMDVVEINPILDRHNRTAELLAGMGLHLGMDIPGWPPENIEDLAKRFEEHY